MTVDIYKTLIGFPFIESSELKFSQEEINQLIENKILDTLHIIASRTGLSFRSIVTLLKWDMTDYEKNYSN